MSTGMAASLCGTTLPSCSSKELFKKATEPAGIRKCKILRAAEVEPDVLIAWWRRSPTLLCRLPGSPIAVILGTFVGVFEDFIGLTEVFKFFLGTWGFINIRMIFARQFPI